MIYDIYYIDWIFIDTIIIVLLFLLLLSVKLFKRTHRWRYSFSNQALEHFNFLKTKDSFKNQLVFTKKWSFIRNSSLKERNNLLVLMISNYRKRKFMRILTEGLCTYGFNVLNLKVKINNITQKVGKRNNFKNEWNFIISTFIEFCERTNINIEPNYTVVSPSKSLISLKEIFLDDNIKGVILINPKLNKQNLKNYINVIEEISSKPQVYNIFSKYSISLFKNYNFLRFLRKFYLRYPDIFKFSTINKARNSFKNYETIVLSILIDIIENKLYNSKKNP